MPREKHAANRKDPPGRRHPAVPRWNEALRPEPGPSNLLPNPVQGRPRPTPGAEALLILAVFGLPASLLVATVLEAFGSGVRFATFFVPASLGALDGANAGAFAALGWTASAGLAFSVVRRARQAVWIGVGLVILLARNASLFTAAPHPPRPVPSDGP